MFKLAKNIKLTKNLTDSVKSFELNKVVPKFSYNNELKSTNIYEQTIKSNHSSNFRNSKYVRHYSSNITNCNKNEKFGNGHFKSSDLADIYIIIAYYTFYGSIIILFVSTITLSLIFDENIYDEPYIFNMGLSVLTVATSIVWPIIPITTYFYYKHNYARVMWKKYKDTEGKIGSYTEFIKKYESYQDFKKKQYPLLSKFVVEK